MSLPTDDTLMDLIAGGDAAACRTLLDRHLGPVLAYCQRILGSRADAEDVAQEVFVRAWAKSPEWQAGTARLTTWLHTVALNLCRDRLRRVRPDPLEDVPEPVDPSLSAEDRVGGREIGHHIDQALAGVWPGWHARFVEGWQLHGFLLWDPVGAFLMALPLALVLAAMAMLLWVSRARR